MVVYSLRPQDKQLICLSFFYKVNKGSQMLEFLPKREKQVVDLQAHFAKHVQDSKETTRKMSLMVSCSYNCCRASLSKYGMKKVVNR